MEQSRTREDFDTRAAVTRSMLGWGVVAGPFYVVVALVLALTRPGFDLSRHAVSLLSLGEFGWTQTVNFVLAGLMTVVAGVGFVRAIRDGRGLAMGVLAIVFGVSLLAAAVFPPDAAAGFPPGSAGGEASTSGILHLVCGGLGFLALAAAAFAYATWCRSRGERGRSAIGILAGVLVLGGFLGGAALSTTPVGVALLWLAVLAGWAWLAIASAHVYAVVPHPVISQRTA